MSAIEKLHALDKPALIEAYMGLIDEHVALLKRCQSERGLGAQRAAALFDKWQHTLSDADYWTQLRVLLFNVEQPFYEPRLWYQFLSSPRPGRELLIHPEGQREMWQSLPERITVYTLATGPDDPVWPYVTLNPERQRMQARLHPERIIAEPHKLRASKADCVYYGMVERNGCPYSTAQAQLLFFLPRLKEWAER